MVYLAMLVYTYYLAYLLGIYDSMLGNSLDPKLHCIESRNSGIILLHFLLNCVSLLIPDFVFHYFCLNI